MALYVHQSQTKLLEVSWSADLRGFYSVVTIPQTQTFVRNCNILQYTGLSLLDPTVQYVCVFMYLYIPDVYIAPSIYM